jgi:serine/threonine protein kinase
MDDLIGESFGAYELIRRIGSGGMGEVYEGRHSLIGKRAAVKVALPEVVASEESALRFFNEARAVVSLRHPAFTEVYDFGHHASGRPYIVMELCDGETLAAAVERRGALPVAEALELAAQVARAMAAAHEAGVVHRDLKPENILLGAEPGEGVRVLDFGIAKFEGPLFAVDRSFSTQKGEILGTPTFMSPEQCSGSGHIDGRSDIYALGCVLYYALTGRPPFLGDGVGAVLSAHIYELPPSPATLVSGIPAAVDAVVMRLLEKRPADRPGSMKEVHEILAAVAEAPSESVISYAPMLARSYERLEPRVTLIERPTPRLRWLFVGMLAMGLLLVPYAHETFASLGPAQKSARASERPPSREVMAAPAILVAPPPALARNATVEAVTETIRTVEARAQASKVSKKKAARHRKPPTRVSVRDGVLDAFSN